MEENRIQFTVRERKFKIVLGACVIAFALFILAMSLCFPSPTANRGILFCALWVMFLLGTFGCLSYCFRSLRVMDLNLTYVNIFGRELRFTVDMIGYCLLKGNDNILYLYDLKGDKLCKLDLCMQRSGEFLQYLIDNRVHIEKKQERNAKERNDCEWDLILNGHIVCREQADKEKEMCKEELHSILTEWEKTYEAWHVSWEYEFARTQTGSGNMELLQLFLKKDGAYVFDKKGQVVMLQFPILVEGKSFRMGEADCIRIMDKEYLQKELKEDLAYLTEILPKNKYHTCERRDEQ